MTILRGAHESQARSGGPSPTRSNRRAPTSGRCRQRSLARVSGSKRELTSASTMFDSRPWERYLASRQFENGDVRFVEAEATMRLALRISIICLFCLLAVGCVKVKVQQWDQVERLARASGNVEVLLEQPEQPYTVIAVVESSYDGALKGYDDLREEMVTKAAELGGDAVILGPESKKTGVMFVATPTPMPIFFDEKKLTGEVIAYNQ